MLAKLFRSLATAAIIAVAATAARADDLLLGYLPALGGPFATLSKTDEIAAQIAIDEINAAGGVGGKTLKIVSFDTAGKPDQAVIGLRKLAEDDKVMAVIGPFSSGECRVVFPAAESEGIVSMSMASSAPKLAEPFTYALRNTSDEGYMFRNVMKTLQDKKYASATAAIAYATDDVISKTMGEIVLPNVMKANGTEIKGSVTFQTQAFDMAPQVSQLKELATDLVGVGSGPESAIRLVQEMHRQGLKSRLVAGSTIGDSELAKRMGDDGNGTVIPTTFYSGVSDKAKAFEAEMIKRAKAAGIDRSGVSQFEAATYDIVQFYAYAIKQAKVTGDPAKLAEERTAVRDALRAMNAFPALEGPISFGQNGDALKTVYVIEMQGGHWNLIGTHPAGT
ncbi:MAG TPA: ABC transporter substrate-binding protein [Xanthobacteraceae bacterium]|jgi:branched-chain amino acid transport system substrate-binding protein|nr:ABC transporter substrate-binding protein [Xanthobacteraceae bacterium]